MEDLYKYLNHITPISDKTWALIKGIFVQKDLKKGDYFCNVDRVATKIAFLQEGIARSFYTNKEGQEFNKNFFVAPAFIGAYSSLITETPNKLAQQVLTNCTIWETDYATIRQLYDICPDLERLGRITAEHYFVEKEIREVNLLMLEAKEYYKIFQQQYPTLEQQIPQYHIASFLGITPTQLSRIRAENP
ncbi:Crp/Fnr family transcriptional regulator [Flavobacterium soyangense]|uniref:Crp/Fnr family transcriptional regulator n=1 Tax=Flavobacterium soyangense TaxID=2023265 RepID=A0A930UES1_9FLAO|nr:Crp/Fnr family transcriptional regulator [Flavobacterium soyangense]MBF2709557.1 Crp/Fnr family transcriptional regulator [Flavobacterium soyangense]